MQLGGHTLARGSQANFSSPAALCHLWEDIEESWLWHPLLAQALSASENIPETWWGLWGTKLL